MRSWRKALELWKEGSIPATFLRYRHYNLVRRWEVRVEEKQRASEISGSCTVWEYLPDKLKKKCQENMINHCTTESTPKLKSKFQKQKFSKHRYSMLSFCLQMVVNLDSLDFNANVKFKFLTEFQCLAYHQGWLTVNLCISLWWSQPTGLWHWDLVWQL